MLLEDLIRKLQDIAKEHGNVPVFREEGHYGCQLVQ